MSNTRLFSCLYKSLLLILVVAGVLSGCTAFQEKDGNSVAYADLNVLYTFVLEHDQEYATVKDVLISKNRDNLVLTDDEERIKEAVILKVESALRYVADNRDIDLVLNKSDGLLYGNSGSDITQLVLNELKIRIYNSSPSTR